MTAPVDVTPRAALRAQAVALRAQADALDALADTLTEGTVEPEPLTLSGAEMARRLGISRSTMHELRKQGCPCVRIGDHHRYCSADVLAWLKARETP